MGDSGGARRGPGGAGHSGGGGGGGGGRGGGGGWGREDCEAELGAGRAQDQCEDVAHLIQKGVALQGYPTYKNTHSPRTLP